jgi:Transposase domain (DUF772)
VLSHDADAGGAERRWTPRITSPNQQRSGSLRLLMTAEVDDAGASRPGAMRCSDGAQGGRPPPYDLVLMFRSWCGKALYNLSDDQVEFMIRDRLSFIRFLGLGLTNKLVRPGGSLASRAQPWERCGIMSRLQPSLSPGRELFCSLADESLRSCSFPYGGHC